MLVCGSCGKLHDRVGQRYCHSCHAASMRKWRIAQKSKSIEPKYTGRDFKLTTSRELVCAAGHAWTMTGRGRASLRCPEHRDILRTRLVEITELSVDGLTYELHLDGALLPDARIDYDGEIVTIDDEVLLPPFKIYRNGVKVFHRKFEGHLPLGMGR